MQISTKTGYALRALAELAWDDSPKPISIKTICQKHNLPVKYIEQLFRKLKTHGLIISTHGAKGGYVLAKPATLISLSDIMHAVDEDFFATYCDVAKNEFCEGLPCGFRTLWDEIKGNMNSYFDSLKLDEIIQKVRSEHDLF
jgi:Rrf2 family iron-sulfur cluster assembly transcriptional regulator